MKNVTFFARCAVCAQHCKIINWNWNHLTVNNIHSKDTLILFTVFRLTSEYIYIYIYIYNINKKTINQDIICYNYSKKKTFITLK